MPLTRPPRCFIARAGFPSSLVAGGRRFASRRVVAPPSAASKRDRANVSSTQCEVPDVVAARFAPVVPEKGELEYRGLVLSNGMRVLLVHNAEEKEPTSVALALGRGSMYDPKDCPGMAHFCEHMLFLGNEAHPEEGEYKRYLRTHGGTCNASTSGAMTNYYFSVVSEYFEGAIDRFLHFFLTPLFTADATSRELNAVDSEYSKNCLSDSRREFYLMKHLANHNHCFSNFGSGNLETLLHRPAKMNIDTRQRLLEFYDKNYSSDIMALVMRSDLPLDTLESVVTKGFSRVCKKGLSNRAKPNGSAEKHFLPENLRRVARYNTIGDVREAKLIFPSSVVKPAKERSDQVVLALLGHEGEGSLCHNLRRLGLVTNVYSSASRWPNLGFGHYSIELTLSEEGTEKLFEVVGEVFKYVAMLKRNMGSVERFWQEQKKSRQVRFDHKPKAASSGLYVKSLAGSLLDAQSPEDVVAHGQLWHSFCADDVMSTLNDICPDNMLVLAAHKEPASFGDLQCTPFFNVDYSLREYTDDEARAMATGLATCTAAYDTVAEDSEGCLLYRTPIDNPFIPENFEILKPEGCDGPAVDRTNPTIVHQNDYVTTFAKQDDVFFTAKVHASIHIVSSVVNFSCKHHVMTETYVAILNMALQAAYFDADVCAQWELSANLTHSSLMLPMHGFSDKLPDLITSMIKDVLAYEPNEQDFIMVKEKMLSGAQNRKMKNSTILANLQLRSAMIQGVSPSAFRDCALDNMKYADLVDFVVLFRRNICAHIVLHGNIDNGGAAAISRSVSDLFTTLPGVGRLKERPVSRRMVCLPMPPAGKPPSETLLASHTPNPRNLDSAVISRFQIGCDNFRGRAQLSVLSKLITPRFFTDLRTKQQLGYGVSSGSAIEHNELSFHFAVRSSVQPPSVVHNRIDVFLTKFGRVLDEMAEDELQESIESSIQMYSAPPANLGQEFSRHVAEILNGTYCWNRSQHILDELRMLTKEDVVQFYRTHFRPVVWEEANARRVITSYAYCSAHAEQELGDVLSRPSRTLDDGSEAAVTVVNTSNPLPWQDTMSLYPPNPVPKVYGGRGDFDYEPKAYSRPL